MRTRTLRVRQSLPVANVWLDVQRESGFSPCLRALCESRQRLQYISDVCSAVLNWALHKAALSASLRLCARWCCFGGGGGIRTRETRGLPVFKTGGFVHSPTPPVYDRIIRVVVDYETALGVRSMVPPPSRRSPSYRTANWPGVIARCDSAKVSSKRSSERQWKVAGIAGER